MVLDEILSRKRSEVATLKRRIPLAKLRQMAEKLDEPKRSLESALSKKRKIHLICELKKASPSQGILRSNFRPVELAIEFEAAGASAISVLTERYHFKGSPGTLGQLRPLTSIPLIRKDFIFDPYQVYETALLKADAFLVIALLLTAKELKSILAIAAELKLDVLVEVHTKEELDRALSAGSKIIGINNRDLKTLRIDPAVGETLLRFVPKGTLSVIESGIENRNDVERYRALGAHCFLIGTSLMKSNHVREKIKELTGQPNGAS